MSRQRLPSSPGGYRTITEQSPVRVEVEAPASIPPGAVSFRGNGWRFNVPAVVLTGLISAFGARLIPAQNSVEADNRAEQRIEALRNAEFREEMRRALSAQSDRQARLETELSSLRISVESTRKQVELLEAK